MFKYLEKEQDQTVKWRKFVKRNLLAYLIPNLLFNIAVPYFSFIELQGVFLFNGEQNLARFLLPMSLFIPFIITFDILKKSLLLIEKGHVDFIVKENFRKNRFIFRLATTHGLVTATIILSIMLCLYFTYPKNHQFDGKLWSFGIGFLAASYSIIFTFMSISKFKKEVLS